MKPGRRCRAPAFLGAMYVIRAASVALLPMVTACKPPAPPQQDAGPWRYESVDPTSAEARTAITLATTELAKHGLSPSGYRIVVVRWYGDSLLVSFQDPERATWEAKANSNPRVIDIWFGSSPNMPEFEVVLRQGVVIGAGFVR